MKYQKYPAQTIKVAGDLRQAPATFENLEFNSCQVSSAENYPGSHSSFGVGINNKLV